jgi:DNA replication protein DnaC
VSSARRCGQLRSAWPPARWATPAQQADDLYELISERAQAGRSLITTSNRNPPDSYPLFPNPVVAESLLDRLINTSHQVFMNGPSYRPNKRPGRAVPQATTNAK